MSLENILISMLKICGSNLKKFFKRKFKGFDKMRFGV